MMTKQRYLVLNVVFKKIWLKNESNLVIKFGSDWCPDTEMNPDSFQIIFVDQIICPSLLTNNQK